MELTVTKCKAAGEDNRVIIALVGSATIGEVEKIKAALLDAFIECRELVFDVREITAADPALLQLIHSAGCTAAKTGIRFSLTGEDSSPFHEAALSAGFLSADKGNNRNVQILLKE